MEEAGCKICSGTPTVSQTVGKIRSDKVFEVQECGRAQQSIDPGEMGDVRGRGRVAWLGMGRLA